MNRKERLKKLVAVQERLKAFHEMRHASFRAEAIAAENEADALRARFDEADAMSSLFPEVYHRRIERAVEKAAENRVLAESEATRVATATARTNMVERAYQTVRRDEERARGERERLEIIARNPAKKSD